jgi:hypothetical protein
VGNKNSEKDDSINNNPFGISDVAPARRIDNRNASVVTKKQHLRKLHDKQSAKSKLKLGSTKRSTPSRDNIDQGSQHPKR